MTTLLPRPDNRFDGRIQPTINSDGTCTLTYPDGEQVLCATLKQAEAFLDWRDNWLKIAEQLGR